MDYNKQGHKENERDKINTNDQVPDLYRICPSQLTKHELEDLYFTVLDTNIQLRKTIQGQEGKIKQLSTKLQRKVAAKKVLEAEEFKDCCVITKTKLRQQKESLAQLRRAHDKTAERIRRINVRLSSEKTPQPSLLRCIRCEPETSSYSRSLKNSPSFLSQKRQAYPKTATASANLRNRVIIMNSIATQTEMPRHNVNAKPYETQADSAAGSTEIESSEAQNEMSTDKDTDNSTVSPKESFKNNYKNVTTQTESIYYQSNNKNIGDNNGSTITTQTEHNNSVMSNVITKSALTQTDPIIDDLSSERQIELARSNVITKSIQTQTDLIIDDLSSEQQIELASYKNNKLNNTNKFQHNALCDKNKCRTHMNELKQKISKLVAELDNTHYMYSTRIGRLEVELQEYRNTNVHEHQYENCMNQLVNNLKEAHVLSTELKEQLAVEKRKVAELVDLMRTIKMSNRVTRTIPQPLVNMDSQNLKNGMKRDSAACTCCSETNMPTNSDKCERKIAIKNQGLPKGLGVPSTVMQQDTSKTETIENLPEIGAIQDTKTDRNILNFTLPKSGTDGSKILRNIYWNSKTHHASDAFPSRNDGIVNPNTDIHSDQRLQENESFLETTNKGSSEDKNEITPIVDNKVNASDAVTSESNMNLDKYNTQGVQKISEFSQVQDIAVTSVNQGPTDTANNRNLANEFNPDFKSSGSRNRKSFDSSNDNKGQSGEKAKKDFDPNILAASLASVAEKQKEQMIADSNLTYATESNLVREQGELSIPKLELSSLPHITEVIFKDSKVEIPVNVSAKPFKNKPCSDQQATKLNPKPEAQSKTTDNIETKPTRSVQREKCYSQQIPSPTPTLTADEGSRKTDLSNLVDEIDKISITREEKEEVEHTKSKIDDDIITNSEEKRRKENTKTKDIPDEIRTSSEEKRRRENAKNKDTPDEIRTSSEEKRRKENAKTKDISDDIKTSIEENRRIENAKTKDIPDEIKTNSEEKRRKEINKTTDVPDGIIACGEKQGWKDNIKSKDIADEIKTNSEEKRRRENFRPKDIPDEIRTSSERRKENAKSKDAAGEIITSSEEKRRKENTKTKYIADEIRTSSEEKRRRENAKTKDIPDEIRTSSEEKRRKENTKTKDVGDEIRLYSDEKRRRDNAKTKDMTDEIRTNSEEKQRKENAKSKDIADEIRNSSEEKRRKENAKTIVIPDETRINIDGKRRKEIADEAIINREEIGQKDNTTTKDVTRTRKENTNTENVTNETTINKEETAQKEVSKIAESSTSSKNYKYTSKNDQNMANKSRSDYRTSSASQTDRGPSWVIDSMNNYYSPVEGVNPLKTNRRESPGDIVPERLDIQKDTTYYYSDVPLKTKREVSMYRRNSGTLCFTTSPGADRLHCECGKVTLCGGLINKDTQLKYEMKDISKYEQGTCTTGCDVCSRATSPENRGDQVLTSIVKTDYAHYIYTPENVSCPSDYRQHNINDSTNINDNNYLRNAEEVATSKAKSTSNNNDVKAAEEIRELMEERLISRVDGTKRVEGTVCDMTEELSSCKLKLQVEHSECQDALNEFDTGRQLALKRGVAKHTINEEYSSKCVFVLHIGTVVLSDEAVLNSRDKSLVLMWKFYNQNVTMTQMTAGRVVLFDFSTEYEVKMTDEFLNYMKHGELRILICEMDKPDLPIASCTLPLRDALLNTNRRADMSLALIAGPETYDRAAHRRISDRLDSRDEMGVLDLWCMLHADANLAPVINRSIAQKSKCLTDQGTDTLEFKNVLQQVTDDKSSANESQDIDIPFSNTYNKSKPNTNGKRLSLHRWGSSVLRLPSREASEEVSEDDANATPESVSIKGKHDPMYSNESKRNGMDVLQLSDVFDKGMLKHKHKGTQAQDTKLKYQKRNATPMESLEYDPSKYPATGRNSGTRSSKDNNMQSTVESVGTNNQKMDMSFPIINEVTANIKSSDDMKRVMNRSSLPIRSRVSKAETSVRQDAFLESQTVGASRTATQEMARLKKARQQRQNLKEAVDKRRKDETDFITMRPDSVILPKEPSDTSNINKKYDNIAKTFIRTEDPTKKQVTIKANHGTISEETPQRDQDSNEEDQTVDITILWLALNEECEAMLNPRVQKVYVAYEFLGRSGADMETPVSLPKPKHYVEKCYFNFKKTFVLNKEDIPHLSHMIRCRAASNIPRSNKDCIVFTVISEPPEDPLGLEICEDIGYANLFLGDLLAYSAGSAGYTEVIPVRSRYGTSVCGVLAVRLDGLDVLRQYLSIVNSQTYYPQID